MGTEVPFYQELSRRAGDILAGLEFLVRRMRFGVARDDHCAEDIAQEMYLILLEGGPTIWAVEDLFERARSRVGPRLKTIPSVESAKKVKFYDLAAAKKKRREASAIKNAARSKARYHEIKAIKLAAEAEYDLRGQLTSRR